MGFYGMETLTDFVATKIRVNNNFSYNYFLFCLIFWSLQKTQFQADIYKTHVLGFE